MEYELTYADTVAEGAALVERIRSETARSGDRRLGFDTEFYDVEVGKYSVLGRAKLHFASFSWLAGGDRFHPRGFAVPRSAVVSRTVVTQCPEFRKWAQEEGWTWLAHNAPVDAHIFKNEGLELKHVVNTLTRARWAWPWRARGLGGGFGLDALGRDVLGEGKLESFQELFTRRWVEYSVSVKEVRDCACGVPKCRKRSGDHIKRTRIVETPHEKYLEAPVPLQEVVPGHELFERAKWYSAHDAVLAKCLDQVISRELATQIREVPWIKSLRIEP